jgi:iron complex transport system permease protein
MFRKKTPMLLCLLMAFLFSLCFRVGMPGFIPLAAMRNLWLGLRLYFAGMLSLPLALDRFDLIRESRYYYESLLQIRYSLITLTCGVIICLSGALFQTVFRNPLASPANIGVSAGTSLGNVVFVYVYRFQALTMLPVRLAYCYGFALLLTSIALVAGSLAGIKVRRFTVLDMIIVGTIISQFTNVFVLYLQYLIESFDTSLVLIYQQLYLGAYIPIETNSMIILAVVCVVSVAPVALIRYHFNLAGFDSDEARSMGARPELLRITGLFCGGLLAATAIIYCGEIGMMAMAIPYVVRYYVSDFREVCIGSMIFGGILLLLMRSLSNMVYIGALPIPAGIITSIGVMPFFLMAARQRRRSAME